MTLKVLEAVGVRLARTPHGTLKVTSDKPLTPALAEALKTNRDALLEKVTRQATLEKLEPLLSLTDYTLEEVESLYTYAQDLMNEYGRLYVYCGSLALTLDRCDPLSLVKARLTHSWGRIYTHEMVYLCKWESALNEPR